MSKYLLKGVPPIKLVNLLKKKKVSLKDYLKNVGIVSYNTLLQKCEKMGVAPPSEEEFNCSVEGKVYSSPQEGVIVLEPQKLVKELTGEKIEVDFFPGKQYQPQDFQKKKKKNQRVQSADNDDTIETNEPNEQVPR
jgi:hypothetical protein